MKNLINLMRWLTRAWIFTAIISQCCFAMTTSERNEALNVHNKLRALHHSPALVWDDELAHYAEQYAASCHFKHSYGEYGENLAAGYPSISAAIQGWYNENQAYSYTDPKFSSQTGHFTQLVWKSSTKIGCALISCQGKNGTPGNYLICEYNPPGNITNYPYFEENVTPPA